MTLTGYLQAAPARCALGSAANQCEREHRFQLAVDIHRQQRSRYASGVHGGMSKCESAGAHT